MSTHNGSPYERGHSDYYYGRRFRPHKRVDGQDITVLTVGEWQEYANGYQDAEQNGDEKDWT